MAGFCEHGNELAGSVNCRACLELLKICELLQMGAASCSWMFCDVFKDMSGTHSCRL